MKVQKISISAELNIGTGPMAQPVF